MHGLGHLFAVGHGLDYGARALDGIAAGKHAGHAGVAQLVGHKQATLVGFQVVFALGDGGAGTLADGDDHAVGRI